MLKKWIIFFFSIVVLSCKQDDYLLYTDIDRIQFGPAIENLYEPALQLADTLKRHTFYYTPTKMADTVFFDIYAIGGPKPFDRQFKLKQVFTSIAQNAVAGVHYVSFDDPLYKNFHIIPAGKIHTSVPIILNRDKSLKEQTFILYFQVEENEYFRWGEKNKIWRKLEFTDRLSKPDSWGSTIQAILLGNYSVRKHEFMIQTTGEKWNEEFINKLTLSEMEYYKAILEMALINYNKNHHAALIDEHGLEIHFP